jgi:hypothetical protein
MQSETKNCQNCKKDFTIESEDFNFYEKIKVPPPTFCPDCRMQRKLAFRNTLSLYRRKDSVTDKDIISIYSPDKNLNVVDQKYWWSDAWDPFDYGKEYDFSKTFFEQWKELRDAIPLQSLSNAKAVNSDYCNVAEENYDCYLCTACYKNERTKYSDSISFIKDSMDLHVVHRTEFSYDDVNCVDSYELFYSQHATSCVSSYFLYDCKGCTNCFMCSNLRSKSYCFENEQLSKEAYAEKMKEINLGDFRVVEKKRKQFLEMKKSVIHRYAHIVNSPSSTGDNMEQAKNCKSCYEVGDNVEDSKYLFWCLTNVKDSYDSMGAGGGVRMAYDSVDVGIGGENYLFSSVTYGCYNVEYCFNCYNSSNLFGCIGLRSKEYCIFNKQYNKDEFLKLREKIIEQMKNMPYIDKAGRVYGYGEFFPIELSPFCYNETVANDYYPLEKEEASKIGFSWKDPEPRNYIVTTKNEDIPNDIKEVGDSIINEVIECSHQGNCNEKCSTAFKILADELAFYRRFNIPLPRLCYSCRYSKRFKMRNPLHLWHRTCMCDKENHSHGEGKCEVEFETSYAPDRPEIVYCEKCYQQEVY